MSKRKIFWHIHSNNNDLITIKPGIHLTNKDDVGQRYTSPENIKNKPDFIYDGRGIHKR